MENTSILVSGGLALLFACVSLGIGLYHYFNKPNQYETECTIAAMYHDQDNSAACCPTRPRAYISNSLDSVRMMVGYLPDTRANRMVVQKALRDHFSNLPDLRKRDQSRMVLEAEFFYFLKTPDEIYLEQLANTAYAKKHRRVGGRA